MQKDRKFFGKVASKHLSNSIHRMKRIIKNKMVVTGTTACAIALLTNSVLAVDSKLDVIQTVYHVYVDGERVGSVDSTSVVDQLVEKKILEANGNENDLDNSNLVIGEQLELVPEKVFNVIEENEETIAELDEMLSVKAEAVALLIDGEVIGYVKNEDMAEDVVKQLKAEYVSETVLETLELKQDQDQMPDEGETVVTDVRLSEEIQFEEGIVEQKNLLTVDKAIKKLTLGTLQDKIHIVEAGDVLGSIASKYNLSTAEILEINPGITEDTLLQIDDEINVTDYEPYIKVIVEETMTVNEEIPFQTEKKEDKSMWKGDTKVQQEGKPGERIVSYAVIKQNGRTLTRKVIEEEVTQEPVNKIVVKGTKVTPSRGTGKFSWPAVGGYISSYQGSRWGRLHKGIDIARPSNRSILAADNGTVSFAGSDGGYGNKVVIDHNNGYSTVYAHLKSISVAVGETVPAGKKIGVMGSTGNSTGVHLHFEIYKDGKLKNPMDYIN